ncbi:MAG: 23S rRNA (adenine(1618)-N(6))-methyltransferase RlmF, partial [Spirosomataceae bacterium]
MATLPTKQQATEKTGLHPRNPHRSAYDFTALIAACPALAPFVTVNAYQNQSIDFANPTAVKLLNQALLASFYDIQHWDIPENYLCPPIPGRADYVHYIADLLASVNDGEIPKGKAIKGLDIGVGANCVYPIIGRKEYGWSFIGSDIDVQAIKSANNIIRANPLLNNAVTCRLQSATTHFFEGILGAKEQVDFTICNPPFHASAEEASAGSNRKVSNLKGKKVENAVLNFGGQSTELWCEGGESTFIYHMIQESLRFAENCFWFTTLVSKKENLQGIYKSLAKVQASEVRTIEMKQGQKISRFVAWTFLTEEQQVAWKAKRWGR